MDQSPSSSWRTILDNRRHEPPPGTRAPAPSPMPSGGYDDGYDPAHQDAAPLSSQEVADEAAMALAIDAPEYRPWVLQRGRSRPALMLHLRRFDAKAGHWTGWAVAYPHLAAVEYVGDGLVSLDFGARQFMLEGRNLGELVDRLQNGAVLCVQEYAPSIWSAAPTGAAISRIRVVAPLAAEC